MASRIITSIPSALGHLQWLQDFLYCYDVQTVKLIRILIHKLRAVRTFLLCSTKIPDNGHMMMEEYNDYPDKSLGSLLLIKIECLVRRTIEDDLSCDVWNKVSNLLMDIESFEEEIDKWYISLSQCLLRSSSPVVYQINDIADSVLENLDDFLSFHKAYVGVLVGPIEALKENITFLRVFLRFATLLCLERHEQSYDFLTQIEDLAFSAAHLTAHLFSASYFNFQLFSADIFADTERVKRNICYDGLKSKISALLLRINPAGNPCVYEAYCKSLACLKYSRDLYVHNLEMSDDPVEIMEDFLVFLLSTLWDTLLLDISHTVDLRDPLQELYEGLRSLRAILRMKRNKFDHHKIVEMIGAAICDAGVIVFSLDKRGFVISLSLPGFLEKLKDIQTEIGKQVLKVSKSNVLKQEIKVQKVTWTSPLVPPQISILTSDEVFVGFETERSSIIDRLVRGSKKLQTVAVVGMPGSGKTTLATQVYNDPSVTHHFHVRAWCSVSQLFQRKKVLMELLNHIQGKICSDKNKSEDDLSQELWRSLKRRRYLIFLDDIWDAQAFDRLEESFPDDFTESRILVTSRHCDAAIVDEKPHLLRQFTASECLELLKRKLFHNNHWHALLYGYGMKIAENCKGLPLTVAIVAGLLTTTKKKVWKEVLKSLRSGVISSTDQCESTITLSYKHLPDHLKPCFLSFGAFPEDYEVSTNTTRLHPL